MTRAAGLALAGLLALGLAGTAARAQEAGPDPAVAPEVNGRCALTEVAAPNGLCLEIPADAPLASCVVGAVDGIDGRERVTVLLAIRQAEGFDWVTSRDVPAVGVYATAPAGTCLVLAGMDG